MTWVRVGLAGFVGWDYTAAASQSAHCTNSQIAMVHTILWELSCGIFLWRQNRLRGSYFMNGRIHVCDVCGC